VGSFLVWLAGADEDVLAGCSRADHAKYVGIGTLILLPGLMGTVSMTFALTTILNFRLAVALPFALGWGLAIICMDRVFVVTMQRGRSWLALPRIVLALLLGFVISTPFVLQIFRPEIEQQIVKIQNQQAVQFIGSSASNKIADQIATDKATIQKLQGEIGSGGGSPDLSGDTVLQNLNQQLRSDQANEAKWYNQWQCQLYGVEQTGGGKCKKGNGPLAQASQAQYLRFKASVASDQSAISARVSQDRSSFNATKANTVQQEQQQLKITQAQLQTDQNLQANETSNFLSRNKEDTGLLVRLKALDEVAAGNSTLEAARWLLFGVLVAIDLMPVALKVLLNWAKPSPYEQMLIDDEKVQLEVAENRRAVWKNSQFRMAQAMERDRLDGMVARLPEIKDGVMAARTRLEEERLRRWEAEQMQRIANGKEIIPGRTGTARDRTEAAREMRAADPFAPGAPRRGRRQPGVSRLQEFREQFAYWREPADPGPQPRSAAAGRPRSARRRGRSSRASSEGLFRRRVPQDTTPASTRSNRMFLREYVPRSDRPGSAPPTDPNGSARGNQHS
jgi:Domain of unknown function (DUF4407)